MSKKRGRLSTDEENYIIRNVHEMDIEEMAANLNRTVAPIQRFIEAKNLIGTLDEFEDNEDQRLRRMLTTRYYWPEVQAQTTEEEQKLFIETWVHFMHQFKEDVEPTEEITLQQWLMIKTKINRCLREENRFRQEISRIRAKIDALKEQSELQAEPTDMMELSKLEGIYGSLISGLSTHTNEYEKLRKEDRELEKSMKAGRSDRIKRIEESKSTWRGYLRMLEDADFRKREGEQIELMRLAKDKAKERLSAYHEFEDGKVDQPFLTPETVIKDE